MKMMYLRMNNPIVEARHMAGLSLDRLGKKLGLSKQYLSRAEQATYSGINQSLTKWVADILDQPKGRVMNDYFAYQMATRKATKTNVSPILLARAGSDMPGYKVFSNWRAMYWTSPTAFSNAMCVHPESVKNYEEGMISSMPDQLKKALRSVGMIDPNWTEQPIEPKALGGPSGALRAT